jgi:phosphatidylglycerol:prolipoprotein diacylglycerol transferase
LGLLALNMSMGQWLCVPMVAVGVWLLWHSQRQVTNASQEAVAP